MSFLRTLVLTLAAAALPTALAASAVDDFKAAMASGDATAKREACRTLAGSSEKDDEVLPLLIGAVADRQTNDIAIQALRARTHLSPGAYRGQSHYPNYPSGDSPADWQTWLAERDREKEQAEKVKDAEKIAGEAKKKADAAEKAEKDKEKKNKKDPKDQTENSGEKTADDQGDKPADAATAKPVRENQPPPQDLGRLDRVVFKNGSNLVCYILTRRTDADGNLISLRVVHPDGSGEETFAADMISRIEEDVKQ